MSDWFVWNFGTILFWAGIGSMTWLAWECLRRAGAPDVKPFGDAFLETLKAVEVLDDDPNG